jgi:methionyl-tRNA synthetase
MDWGIPVPVEGYEDKVLYVWFEAVIGYLSATIEWAANNGAPDAWRNWWQNPSARTVYFIGKDNIPFHTVMWPAQLLGARVSTLRIPSTAQPALRCAGQRVHEHGRAQDQRQHELGRVDAGRVGAA